MVASNKVHFPLFQNKFYPDGGTAKSKDALAFVDLLKQLLHLDGDCRISAYDALQQPFITMTHLDTPGCKT